MPLVGISAYGKSQVMNPESFFGELKRRNVYKVAVAYAVVSWLLIQAASILFPTFDAPSWAMKVFVALLVLCFPVALVLSWAFEITPDGIKLESEIDPKKSISKKTGRKIVGLTVVVAIISAGLMIFQIIRPQLVAKSQGATGDLISIPAKSIAVLPFDSLSRDPDTAYLCEGVQDEILTRLAKVRRFASDLAHQLLRDRPAASRARFSNYSRGTVVFYTLGA